MYVPGHDAFNMSLFVALDAVHGGPLLSDVAPAHVISALVAIVLMAAGLSALVYRAKRRFALLEPSGDGDATDLSRWPRAGVRGNAQLRMAGAPSGTMGHRQTQSHLRAGAAQVRGRGSFTSVPSDP
jgi:hypothetical protein